MAERFNRFRPCPICGGWDQQPRGQGKRCYGYLDSTGDYARCTREELAGLLPRNEDGTFSHRLQGWCHCGATHQPEPFNRAAETPAKRPSGRSFPTLEAAIDHYQRRGAGRHLATYTYVDERGEALFAVLRFDPKTFRQVGKAPDGWTLRVEGCRRVVYHLPEVVGAGTRIVFITEGEKDADRLQELGLIATTAPGGARKWRTELSEQLAGHHVALIADHDAEGEAHVELAAPLLHEFATSVRVVHLPRLQQKGDVSDWLDQGHTLDELKELVRATPLWQASEESSSTEGGGEAAKVLPIRRHQEFPLAELPEDLAAYVEEAAAALQVSTGMVATASLACAAAAVGASRSIEIKVGWDEMPAIWATVITQPGGGKSPAIEAASAPLRAREDRTYAKYKQDEKDWEVRVKEWADAPKRGRGAAPERPTWERLIVDDITTEELGNLLIEHPRGLLQLHDEMSGLVRGFDQYKSKGSGSDRSRYLKMWSFKPLHIDRKGSHDHPIYVRRPCLSILGALQPDIVDELREGKRNDGFIDRFLFDYEPDLRPRHWSEARVGAETRARYADIFDHLLKLEMESDEYGLPQPRQLDKSDAGHETWTGLYDEHEDERAHPDLPPAVRGYFEKCKAYAGRLALLIHLIRRTGDRSVAEAVDEDSVRRAWTIVDYYKAHAREVYSLIDRPAEEKQALELIGWMRRRGLRRTSTREVCRAEVAGVRTTSAARSLFDYIRDRGWGMTAVSNRRGPQVMDLILGPSAAEANA